MARRGNYDVGYGRPPKHSQWKPGQSGNPKGSRSKAATGLTEMFAKEFDRRHKITVGNREKIATAAELLIGHMFKMAFKGNMKACELLLDKLNDVSVHRKVREERKVAAMSGRPRITGEQLELMSESELTELYMKTLKEVNSYEIVASRGNGKRGDDL